MDDLHDFKIGDSVEHLKLHLLGVVVNVGYPQMRVNFTYVKSKPTDIPGISLLCTADELRKL
jgi:hypothetical protein